MPAAMVHGGGGVLLMITTEFAPQQTINKHNFTSNANKARSLTTISNSKQQHKITSENKRRNKHPAQSNKLTTEIKFYQMKKMHQR